MDVTIPIRFIFIGFYMINGKRVLFLILLLFIYYFKPFIRCFLFYFLNPQMVKYIRGTKKNKIKKANKSLMTTWTINCKTYILQYLLFIYLPSITPCPGYNRTSNMAGLGSFITPLVAMPTACRVFSQEATGVASI